MIRYLTMLAVGLSILLAHPAHAKKATIKWAKVKGAVSYEIQIKLEEKTIVDDKLKKGARQWHGPLEPGLYHYRIRVVDKIGRAGEWSQYHPLVVKPEAPKGKKAVQDLWTDERGGIALNWSEIKNVKTYLVTIKLGKRTLVNKEVNGTSLYVPGLQPGAYKWQVQGVLKAGKRVPASISGMKASGDLSEPVALIVRKDAPQPKWRFTLQGATGAYKSNNRDQDNDAPVTNTPLGTDAGISAAHYLNPRWDLTASADLSFLRVSTRNKLLIDTGLFAEFFFGRARRSQYWGLSVIGGLQYRDFIFLELDTVGSVTTRNVSKFSTVGGLIGLKVHRKLSYRMNITTDIRFFTPITVVSDRYGESLSGSNLFSSIALDIFFNYRFTKNFGLSLGFKYDRHKANFTRSGNINVLSDRPMYYGLAKLHYFIY